MATNVVEHLDGLPSAQKGYFTRAQATAAGIEDFDLTRATSNRFIQRVGHGVYRVSGAAYDRFADLRVAWLRLAPGLGPRERATQPRIWVSHESAAAVHGFGVFLADKPTFTAIDRLQPTRGVKVYRRSRGLERHEWTIRDGFAVTSVNRTISDLRAAGIDGGHLGRFIADAIQAGATEPDSLTQATGICRDDLAALVAMGADKGVT